MQKRASATLPGLYLFGFQICLDLGYLDLAGLISSYLIILEQIVEIHCNNWTNK